MTRAEEILQAVAVVLEARRECLEDRGLCSVLIEAKVNPRTGVVRAALVGRRKIPVPDKPDRVHFF